MSINQTASSQQEEEQSKKRLEQSPVQGFEEEPSECEHPKHRKLNPEPPYNIEQIIQNSLQHFSNSMMDQIEGLTTKVQGFETRLQQVTQPHQFNNNNHPFDPNFSVPNHMHVPQSTNMFNIPFQNKSDNAPVAPHTCRWININDTTYNLFSNNHTTTNTPFNGLSDEALKFYTSSYLKNNWNFAPDYLAKLNGLELAQLLQQSIIRKLLTMTPTGTTLTYLIGKYKQLLQNTNIPHVKTEPRPELNLPILNTVLVCSGLTCKALNCSAMSTDLIARAELLALGLLLSNRIANALDCAAENNYTMEDISREINQQLNNTNVPQTLLLLNGVTLPGTNQ
ncbi:hypothetical protein C9374_007238 [Naegleria lovaniensis]|uniref:Uncharacterized protein n=1 Tax=Naegleria lovaniensis TaxID=51637 RepID=A0AA88H746_NAELO|nr:uncharacterized protein C9374_007238 [Naegleria lovaniensis]KAG2393707.1 hypothetical protein C9374_007238 [Naegleria lovaniensis]